MLPSIIASEYNQEKQRPSSFSTEIINKIGTLGPTISGLKKKKHHHTASLFNSPLLQKPGDAPFQN